MIKNEYSGPIYPGHEILIAETLAQILTKASDYLSISQSQNSQFNIKRITEKLKDVEEELKKTKVEYQAEISEKQQSIASF